MVAHFRPVMAADISVDPDPPKGSATHPPSGAEVLQILAIISTGLGVACPCLSSPVTLENFHTSYILSWVLSKYDLLAWICSVNDLACNLPAFIISLNLLINSSYERGNAAFLAASFSLL